MPVGSSQHEEIRENHPYLPWGLSGKLASLFLWLVGLAAVLIPANVQFVDADTLIYSLVGRGIYQHGIMPYDFVFDHKPFLTYFVYGILDFFSGSNLNIFSVFGALCLMAFSRVLHGKLDGKKLPLSIVFLFLACAYVITMRSSGNTEVVYVPLSIVAVLLLTLKDSGSVAALAVAALLAAMAFNINYIAAFPLFPALVYALYHSSKDLGVFLKRTAWFGVIALAFIVLMLVGVAALGGDLEATFMLQWQFLIGYSDGGAFGIDPGFAAIWAGSMVVVGFQWIPGLRPAKHLTSTTRALAIYAVFASVSFLMSGKYYLHYLFMVAAPAVIVFALLNFEHIKVRILLPFAVIMASLLLLFVSVYDYARYQKIPDAKAHYAQLRAVTEGRLMLSIRNSVVPVYFSHAEPSQPYNWLDHTKIIFGPHEAEYFLAELGQKPMFILTPHAFCQNVKKRDDTGFIEVCGSIAGSYDLLQSTTGLTGLAGRYIQGYDLYQKVR